MPYNFQEQRPFLFTEEGVKYLLSIRSRAEKLLAEAGAFRADKVMEGDTWMSVAVLDYMIELGELRLLTPEGSVKGQNEVFVRG